MEDFAIKVGHVSKSFKLPHEKNNSIKGAVVNFYRHKKSFETQKVLDDISFEIKKGDFFGIVGRNGSGKSTLLKLIAGIYSPTSGIIEVCGKLTPFIELGVGFNPELTGRENVFLNGALLGFSRKEMLALYENIVKFDELGRFMDQKLKNYSSGMQVRLAFSIAIRANTDVLVLDEVLAVGDEAFQRKCFSYFEKLKRNKKTVVLVTHDMAAVERYCNKAIFIEDGEILKSGDPRMVAAAYSRSNNESYIESNEAVLEIAEKEVKEEAPIISDINIKIPENSLTTFGDTLKIDLSWTKTNVKYVGVAIMRQSGEYIFGQNTYQDKLKLGKTKSISYEVKLNLGEGEYFIKAGIFGNNDADIIDFEESGPSFVVHRNENETRWGGLTKLVYEWRQNV